MGWRRNHSRFCCCRVVKTLKGFKALWWPLLEEWDKSERVQGEACLPEKLLTFPLRPAFCLLPLSCLSFILFTPFPQIWVWLADMSLSANWSNWLAFVNTAALFGLGDGADLCCKRFKVSLTLVSVTFLPFSECHACYHRSCFRTGKDCPRCQRLAERRERMARKNMEEQEDEGGGT